MRFRLFFDVSKRPLYGYIEKKEVKMYHAKPSLPNIKLTGHPDFFAPDNTPLDLAAVVAESNLGNGGDWTA